MVPQAKPGFLIGEGPNHKLHALHAMTSSQFFERRTFVGQRCRRMEDQGPWPGLPKLKSENVETGRRV